MGGRESGRGISPAPSSLPEVLAEATRQFCLPCALGLGLGEQRPALGHCPGLLCFP